MEKGMIQQDINGIKLTWDVEKGLFQFEGADVVLFWIESAFRTLLETIEEVAGSESANVVFETAGYRMGKIISSHFRGMGDSSTVLQHLPGVYGAAGWGRVSIEKLCIEEKKAIVRIKNSWEHRIGKIQGRKQPGRFLPGHFAGVFASLFEENIWYTIKRNELEEDEYDEFEFFSSAITPERNIHDLIRKKEQEQIRGLEQIVQERTRELMKLVQDLSSPVIPVMEDIIVIPLMGKFDDRRAEELRVKALEGILEHQAKFLLLDVTALREADEYTISLLDKLTQSARLVGSTTVLVGVSTELSLQLVNSTFDMKEVKCFSTLKHGIHHVLSLGGLHITKKEI